MTFLTDMFDFDDNCTLIIVAVAAYFLLTSGCLENILGEIDTQKLLWIAAIGAGLYLIHKNGCCCL